MKSVRNIALTALLTMGAFGAVTFTACNKDDEGCPTGYEGDKCETQSRNRFLTNGTVGTFVTGIGEDECYDPGYTMTIAPGANDDEIIIANFAGFGNSALISGVKVNGMTFTKAGTVTAGEVTLSNISGTISEDGSVITYGYRATDEDGPIECSATSTKQ